MTILPTLEPPAVMSKYTLGLLILDALQSRRTENFWERQTQLVLRSENLLMTIWSKKMAAKALMSMRSKHVLSSLRALLTLKRRNFFNFFLLDQKNLLRHRVFLLERFCQVRHYLTLSTV